MTDTERACASGDPTVEQRIAALVRADLALQKVEVCSGPPQAYRPPLATVRIQSDCSADSRVTIALFDNVTQKQLSRHVVLAGLPRDTHALAIAVGAVELLRASWAETRLQGPNGVRSEVPGAVEQFMGTAAHPKPFQAFLGIGLAGEAFAGGLRQIGMDAEFTMGLLPRLEVLCRVGGRTARSVVSRNGSVVADGWLVGIGTSYLFLRPSSHVELRAMGRLDGMRLEFSGIADKAVTARSRGGLGLWTSAGFVSSVRFADRAWVDTEILGGWVIRPVAATDAGQRVMGAKGDYVGLRLAMRLQF